MDPALQELLRGAGSPYDEVALIVRLRDPAVDPPQARVVSRFGDVATVRVRRADVEALWRDPTTASVKAPQRYAGDVEDDPGSPQAGDDGALPEREPQDDLVGRPRATPTDPLPADLGLTGAGVVVGLADWGLDMAHPDFRRPDGRTRLVGLWDQREVSGGRAQVEPYGYGRFLTPEGIDAALATDDPYDALGYHPADFDGGGGAHGTHTFSIAAGNGRGGGPAGLAPEADMAFVSLGGGRAPGVPLGSSTQLLEAIDFLGRCAGPRPLVVSCSLGRHAGAHRGCTLLERALDHFVTAGPGRAVVQSCGNYYARRTHASWQLYPGDRRTFAVHVDPGDTTPNVVDIWYPGDDRLRVEVACPELGLVALVSLGQRAQLTADGESVARVYHRAFDPNSGDHQCSVLLEPTRPAQRWEVTLHAEDVVDGRVHAWIERDTGCRTCQSIIAGPTDPRTTTGTIANGFRTLVVGAVDGARPDLPVAPFSSSGPTRDARGKPDLVAYGVRVLGARSCPRGLPPGGRYVRMSGTSMAAPAVAGTVALLYQRHGPVPIEVVRRLVLSTCAPLPDADPARVGAGLLQTEAAVNAPQGDLELDPALRRIAAEARTVPALRPWTAPHAAEWEALTVAERLQRPDMRLSAAARTRLERRLGGATGPGTAVVAGGAGRSGGAGSSAQSYLGLLTLISAGRPAASLPPDPPDEQPCGCHQGTDSEAAPTCVPAAEPGTGGAPHPTVRIGSFRPVVGHAQSCLNTFLAEITAGTRTCRAPGSEPRAYVDQRVADLRAGGQLPLRVDCRFGTATELAVKAVQACFGLDRDGVVGRRTWPVLDSLLLPATTTAYRILVDAARNGRLTDAPTTWTWGAAGRGAVVLVNNDDDNRDGRPDHEDSRVDLAGDTRDIVPLVLELVGPLDPTASLALTLSDALTLRVLDGTAAGATELAGPARGATHRFAAPVPARLELGMEAVRYAQRGVGGEVSVTLRWTGSGGGGTASTSVRVAPWLVPNHLDRAEEVLVVDAGAENAAFRNELRRVVTAAGCRLTELSAGGDVWMQDGMEIGYATAPGLVLRTVLRLLRDGGRSMRSVVQRLLAPERGLADAAVFDPLLEDSVDFGGNLECSPPVTVGGHRFPAGRIYFGTAVRRPFNAEVREFLHAQLVQRPIEVDTSWLAVGHVDEVLSFVPAPGPKGFKMLVASPRRAYAILDELAASSPSSRMLIGRSFPVHGPTRGSFPVEQTVSDFLTLRDDFHPDVAAMNARRRPPPPAAPLRAYNARRQTDVERMSAAMTVGLGLDPADVVEVPAVFMPNSRTPTLADALIPGMVNMLVVNGHCAVARPFGPVVGGVDQFERDLSDALTRLGVHVTFLDDWDSYHVALGEVHCATNVWRTAPAMNWWEFTP